MQITFYSSSKRALSTNGEVRRWWSYGVGVHGEQWCWQENATKLGLGSSFRYQHRFDSKHTAEIVKFWLLYNVPNQLHTPSQSPDLNTVEHLCFLERKIRQHNISSKDMLKIVFKDEWEKITAEGITKLVNSMPKRPQEVLERRGYPTRYYI
ncbi:transposable element Tcb1 transposase [Trichonephila clavipes]|nr:transposable element Tcb1 transposase [Trichonephila clavipes]